MSHPKDVFLRFKGFMISNCIINSLGNVIYIANFPISWTRPATNSSLLSISKSTAIVFAARAQYRDEEKKESILETGLYYVLYHVSFRIKKTITCSCDK